MIIGIVDGVSPSDSDTDDYDELTIVDSSMAYFGGEIADVEAPDGLTTWLPPTFQPAGTRALPSSMTRRTSW